MISGFVQNGMKQWVKVKYYGADLHSRSSGATLNHEQCWGFANKVLIGLAGGLILTNQNKQSLQRGVKLDKKSSG
jgi:hypothetical protein